MPEQRRRLRSPPGRAATLSCRALGGGPGSPALAFDSPALREASPPGRLLEARAPPFFEGPAEALGVRPEAVRRLLAAADAAMPANPYHNSAHVLDALQLAHLLVSPGS